MPRAASYLIVFGLGSLVPLAIDVVFDHWYWNRFYAKGL